MRHLADKAQHLLLLLGAAAIAAAVLLLVLPMQTAAGTGNGLWIHYNDRQFISRLMPGDPNEPWYDEVFGEASLASQQERRRYGAAGLTGVAITFVGSSVASRRATRPDGSV